jgi:uncharacterized protein with PQ loop repeat
MTVAGAASRDKISKPRLRSSWSPANAATGPSALHSGQEFLVTETIALMAASWGVFMALSPLLQIRRMLQRRSSRDVSISYFGVLLIGFGLWVAYGFALGNAALIVPNSVALVIGSATVLIALRFRGDPGD